VSQPAPPASRTALSAFSVTLLGVGLARFAYAPLMPALVEAGWFSAAEAAYIGAANLVGYLAGAMTAPRLAGQWGAVALIRAALAIATLAFFACAQPWGYMWFLVWRFAAGVAGAHLMVTAPSIALAAVPPARRGRVGGITFTGVGLGIALSGTLVPLLVSSSLPLAWIALGTLATLLSAVAWGGWGATAQSPATGSDRPRIRELLTILRLPLAVYTLSAVGLVPHMVFLVDYVARGLGRGIAVGGSYWVLFGLGAMLGPLAAGRLADAVGFGAALRLACLVLILALLPPLLWPAPVPLAVSALIMGAFTPGMPPLVLGRMAELAPTSAREGWAIATTGFALATAAGAWGMSAVYAATDSHWALFAIALVFIAMALAAALVDRRLASR
jgi:predicted MFS family arabinose efflux permease